MTNASLSRLSRRGFLGSSAAMLGASALTSGVLAQGAKFRRWEITDPAMPAGVLTSYKAGISKMLSLPPTDPRNWYRNALVHLFDCPHGNWWFLVWHRAYLGWLEATLRDLSGDPEFALPYWDWAKTPRVPAAMFDGVLDPNDGAFISTFDQFKTQFELAITALYASFSQAQKDQLANRPFPFTTPAEFWDVLPQVFFDQPSARGLTATNPDLDANTKVTVATNVIRSALQTPTFAGSGNPNEPAGFQSAKAANHSSGSRQGILESQPHNNVHGAMGGGAGAFMVSFFSSVDPIFYLHHGKAQISLHGRTSNSCSSATKRVSLSRRSRRATTRRLAPSITIIRPVRAKTRCRRLAQRLRRLRPRSSKVKSPLLRLLLGQRQALSCRCQQLR